METPTGAFLLTGTYHCNRSRSQRGVWPKPTPVCKPLRQFIIKRFVVFHDSGFIKRCTAKFVISIVILVPSASPFFVNQSRSQRGLAKANPTASTTIYNQKVRSFSQHSLHKTMHCYVHNPYSQLLISICHLRDYDECN